LKFIRDSYKYSDGDVLRSSQRD